MNATIRSFNRFAPGVGLCGAVSQALVLAVSRTRDARAADEDELEPLASA